MAVEVSGVYRKAAKIIEKRKIGRHWLVDGKGGPVCLLGAVALAYGMEEEFLLKLPEDAYEILSGNQAVRLLSEYIVQEGLTWRGETVTKTVWSYADAPGIEQGHIVRLLKDAAKHYDEV